MMLAALQCIIPRQVAHLLLLLRFVRCGCQAMNNEWKTDSALRVKRFEATTKAKKVVSLETMIRDLDGMATALFHQIAAEEERTKVRDARRVNYSIVALSAATRRRKLMVSLVDLRAALETAKREHAAAADDARNLELALGVPNELQPDTKRRGPPGRGNGEVPV